MKIKYIAIALFSLGLIASSCGKKKKGDHKEHTEQHVGEAEHDHGSHEGHDHGSHEGHNH